MGIFTSFLANVSANVSLHTEHEVKPCDRWLQSGKLELSDFYV